MKNKETTLNRREFVRLNTAAFAGALLTPAIATGKEPQRKAAEGPEIEPLGFYRFGLGDLKITVINDGFFHLSEITPPDMQPIETLAFNASEGNRQEYLVRVYCIVTAPASTSPLSVYYF